MQVELMNDSKALLMRSSSSETEGPSRIQTHTRHSSPAGWSMETLTEVVSNGIRNVNLSILVFRPVASVQETRVPVPLSRLRGHHDVKVDLNAVSVLVCRDQRKSK